MPEPGTTNGRPVNDLPDLPSAPPHIGIRKRYSANMGVGNMDPSMADRLSLALLYVINSALHMRCTTPPNAQNEPVDSKVPDRLISWMLRGSRSYNLKSIFQVVFALYNVALICSYPNPPPMLCPRRTFPQNVDPTLFTWNSTLVAVLVGGILAAVIRLAAYANLGQDFTFALRQPDGLVTGGVHKYIQHPSYTGLLILMAGNFWYTLRANGLLACWLPTAWVQAIVPYQFLAPLLLGGVCMPWVFWLRVKDEESMLKKTFGKQWVEYHSKTARFIPGVL